MDRNKLVASWIWATNMYSFKTEMWPVFEPRHLSKNWCQDLKKNPFYINGNCKVHFAKKYFTTFDIETIVTI